MTCEYKILQMYRYITNSNCLLNWLSPALGLQKEGKIFQDRCQCWPELKGLASFPSPVSTSQCHDRAWKMCTWTGCFWSHSHSFLSEFFYIFMRVMGVISQNNSNWRFHSNLIWVARKNKNVLAQKETRKLSTQLTFKDAPWGWQSVWQGFWPDSWNLDMYFAWRDAWLDCQSFREVFSVCTHVKSDK